MDAKEDHNLCQHCGRPLGPKAIQGLCPACLLRAGWPTGGQTEPVREGMGLEPPSIEDLARLFPQLEVLDLIGHGGMGAVYKARQRDLDRLVALKVLPDRAGADPGFTERFTREARALARLNHPNIVAVYEFGQVQGLHYFIMEYVDGTNLRQVERSGGLEPRQALAIIPQICEALQFAHDKGIVHRDIKPENILIDRDGHVKIADFGLAKILGQRQDLTLTAEGHVMGTPHYMAPEQVEHPQAVDHRADIYSLGVVFYEMLTGELPLGKFQPPSAKVQIDVRLDEVVLRALAKEPDRRYQQASQVKTEVETIAAGAANPESRGQKPEAGAPLKVSLCYISTPEYLRSFRGRFYNICQGKGELCLDRETLSFRSGWQAVTIPLASIQSLALGEYPSSAKPVPLHFIAVTFAEHGASRTLLFTPVRTEIMTPWEANKIGDDWVSALREGVQARTGHTPSVGHLDVAQEGFWSGMAKAFLLTVVTCTATFALIPLILEHRLPNRLSELMWGPITAALTMVLLLAVRGWRRLAASIAGPHEEPSWPIVAALSATVFFAGMTLGVAIIWALPWGGRLNIALFAIMVVALPLIVVVSHRSVLRWQTASPTGQRPVGAAWLRAWAWIAWVLAVPFVGFGMFFLHSLITSSDSWNPATDEAVIVPLIWLGWLLLPLSGWILWGAARRARRAAFGQNPSPWATAVDMDRGLSTKASSWVTAARWTARLLGTLCILLLIPFVLAEGLPPLTQQPEGVQLTFVAGLLLVLGFIIGWWREGTAALLIATGWTLFNVSENRIEWGPFHGVLIIAAAYAYCWWATHGRRTGVLAFTTSAFILALVLGRIFCPTSVLVTGLVTDAVTGQAIPNAEITLADPRRPSEAPNARTSREGRYTLYVGWYSEGRDLRVSAQGYAGLATSLGPRPMGQKRLNRDLRLTPAFGPVEEVILHTKGAEGQEVLDLDTGKILPLDLPKELANAPSKTDLVKWMADRGVDLAFEFESRSPLPLPSYLCTTDLLLVLRPNEEWETATETALSLALAQGAPGVRVEHQGPVKAYRLEAQTKLPLTFAFKTAQGGLGLLQVTELIDKPRGVKIRYRLVQTQEGSTQAPALASKVSAEGNGKGSDQIGAALQFRLVAEEGSSEAVDLMPDPIGPSDQAPLRVLRKVLMDGSAVAGADMTFEQDGRRSVSVKLTEAGSRQFSDVTGSHVKRRLAIVFRGRVVSAPVIQAPITGERLMISGRFLASEVHEMVDALNRASRPTDLSWTLAGPFEVVLPWVGQEPNFVLYDLDTDRWTTNREFRPDLREFHEWLCSVGADVIALGREPELPFVTGYDMVFAAAPDRAWDVVTAGDLVQCMALNDVLPSQEIRRAKAPGEADTFLFRTREDGRGVLQILGFSDDRKGVKIRYTRIQATGDRPAPGH